MQTNEATVAASHPNPDLIGPQRLGSHPGRVGSVGRILRWITTCALLWTLVEAGYGANLYTFTARDGFYGGKALGIAESTNGNIWVGSGAGVWEFDGRWIHHPETNGPGMDGVLAVDIDKAGKVWAGNEQGLYRWDSKRWEHFNQPRVGRARLRSQKGLRCASNGNVWVTGVDRRIHQWRGGAWSSYGQEAGLPDDFGTDLACDQRGQVWVTFELGDVACFDGRTWRVWRIADRPWKTGRHGGTIYATSVAVDARTNIWVGTWEGLYQFDGRQWIDKSPRTLAAPEGLCVQGVAVDHQDRVWYASFNQGIFYFDGEAWQNLRKANYALPGDLMEGVFHDSRNQVWLSERGLNQHRLTLDAQTIPLSREGLQLSAQRVIKAASGDLWVTTSYSWINTYLYSGADLRRYRADGSLKIYGKGVSNLLTKDVRDLKLGPDGTLWAATACGLFRFDGGQFEPCSLKAGEELVLSRCSYRADPEDKGRKEEWFRSVGTNEGWSVLEPPVWPTEDFGLRKPDALGWYCIRFDVPRSYEGWDLLFVGGQAHDEDEFFCNGERIGSNNIGCKKEMADIVYVVPRNVIRPGAENALHIRLKGILQPATVLQKPRLTPIVRFFEDLDLTAVTLDRQGRVCVSTRTGQFARYDGSSWTTLPISTPELANESIVAPCMYVDRDNALWIGTSNVLKILPAEASAALDPADLPTMRGAFPHLKGVRAMGEDDAGTLWIATDEGLGRWFESAWRFAEWPFDSHPGMLVTMAVDHRGRVWAGTCCKDLTVYNGRVWSVADVYRRVGQRVRGLALDGDRGLWAACMAGGLAYNRFDSAPPHVKLTSPPTQVSAAGKVMFSWEAWDQWQETPREELAYLWRLDEGQWSGPQSEAVLFLESLKPGQHKFAVKALDRDLNESEASLASFSVAWPIWKQDWFLGLVGGLALLVMLSAAFAWSRHERLKTACTDLETSTVALEKANAKLRELDQLKTQFLSNVSHELRTPLTSIKGSADNLLDGIVGQLSLSQREYVELIRTGTHRLIPLVDDLLDLARIENGQIALVRQALQVDGLLDRTVKSLQPLASEQQVTLRFERPGSPLTVQVDADRISQVITNLVGNALRFTPVGGKITILAEQTDAAFAQISVADTGPGIPENEQGRIFEKFYQVQGQAMPQHHGAGLGLSIAKGIVEAHGGVIGVKNNPGGGSMFWFTLPLVTDRASPPGQERNS